MTDSSRRLPILALTLGALFASITIAQPALAQQTWNYTGDTFDDLAAPPSTPDAPAVYDVVNSTVSTFSELRQFANTSAGTSFQERSTGGGILVLAGPTAVPCLAPLSGLLGVGLALASGVRALRPA